MAEYRATIGLEVHAQILTASKMFCGCPAETESHGAAAVPPNSRVCPICLGLPGTLPTINTHAIQQVIRTALALHCEIAPFTKMDRKNYLYPDLMKGYQISQYDLPISHDGWLEIETATGPKRIGIIRVHMEEDTARLLHRRDAGGAPYTLIDVNRGGVPLMEIVGAPDIASPEEARLYLTKLRQILQYIGVSTGNMEEGAFRCDANVSVRPVGQAEYGTKVEVKNMNSFRAVERALAYEIRRQSAALAAGETIAQETRGWVDETGETVSQRSKEYAHDYRYFPEPDLPPLTFTDQDWSEVIAGIPELPDARRARFMTEYGLPEQDADLLTATRPVADYYEAAVTAARAVRPVGGAARSDPAKAMANLILNDLMKLLPPDTALADTRVTPAHLAALWALIEQGTITSTIAREQVLPALFETGENPAQLVEQRGLAQVRDDAALRAAAAAVLADAANAQSIADFRGGKDAAIKRLLGGVMRATGGKANPQLAEQVLRELLSSEQ
jgi:aspartyl-tRNA(Asn)/glutamyl-tRNA(Gln) amidotransferase subunit B